MNKFITKVAKLVLGLSLAAGVGVAVGSNARAYRVDAANSTYQKVNSLAAGKEVLIVSHSSGGQYYLMDAVTAATSAGPKYITFSLSNGNVVGDYDSHLFTVAASSTNWKFSTGTKYLKWSGTSSNTAIRINTGDSNNTWTYSNGTMKFSSAARYLGVYTSGSDWRSYNSSTASNYSGTGGNIEFYEKVSSKTLSSIAIKTAPSTLTYYEGQKFNPTGLVITATYSDSSTEDIAYADHSSDFSFTPSISTALTTSNTSVTIGWGGKTTTQAITVNSDTLNSVTLSGTMSTTTYTTAQSWSAAGLVVTASYTVQGNVDVTSNATFKYYSDSAMTSEVSTPEDLGIGSNQTIYIKATVGGVSNSTGYSQTVTVNEAPAQVVINHADVANSGTNYATRNWTSGTISGTTLSAINSGGYFQFQKTSGANACFIANSDAIPGPITKVEITKKGTSATTAFDAYFSTSQISSKPVSGEVSQSASNNVWTWNVDESDEFTYFYIVNGADDTKYFDDITITYKKVSLVDPTEITLNNSSAISMDTYGYGKRKLVATVEPYNANDHTVTWGSNNTSIVTISDGVLTPVGVGSTSVYACTSNYDPENPNPDLIKTVSVTVTQAEYEKATFTPTSGSSATQSDDYLAGGSIAVSGNWNSTVHAIQLTTNNSSATFTISGYSGMEIVGVDLVMSSNSAAGTGSLNVTIGSTEVLDIETAPFSDASWNGAYDANPCELYKDTTDYVVKANEDIVFSFGATVNSIYVYSVSVRYLDYSLEQWCVDFINNFTCDATGASAPSVSDWDDFGLEFLDLAADLKLIAKNATANESGTNIEKAMAKYDYVVGKYGDATYDDFIERSPAPLSSAKALLANVIGENNNTIAIIVVISMVSVTAIGGYFFIKKRKAQ